MKPLAQNSMIQNRYLIVQPIGKGGMGEVYLAVDQRLGSAVALKRTFFNEDETLGSAFEREARILGRLRHPVLPKVIDHFIENNDQFLVMEHISGDDLAKRLESANKPFPVSWVMFWADQMLDALNYLHSHEPPIVHRDIKPQNLKLTDENHIVLLDFGLSKDFDTAAANSLNSASVAGYSPHFASMEQIRGTGTDARSDLYSLSATLYQLLANQAPADALTRADALLAGRKDPIIPLSDHNSEVSRAVSDVILKGIAIRQEERYTSANEMQKALRRAFNQGKAESAVETEEFVSGELPAVLASASQEEVSEMATRVRPEDDTPGPAPTAKLDRNVASPVDEYEKTEAYSAAEVDARDLKIEPEQAAEIAALAAAAMAASPPVPEESDKTPIAESGLGEPSSDNGTYQPLPPPPVESRSVPQAKKSSSRMGLVIGGLVGFLVLSAIVAGGGWYAYTNYASSAPSPAPSVAPSVEPTPQPTPVVAEVTLEGDANSNVEAPPTNTAELTNSSGAKPAPPTTAKAPPSRTAPPTGQKPPPKPKGDDRTKILQ